MGTSPGPVLSSLSLASPAGARIFEALGGTKVRLLCSGGNTDDITSSGNTFEATLSRFTSVVSLWRPYLCGHTSSREQFLGRLRPTPSAGHAAPRHTCGLPSTAQLHTLHVPQVPIWGANAQPASLSPLAYSHPHLVEESLNSWHGGLPHHNRYEAVSWQLVWHTEPAP